MIILHRLGGNERIHVVSPNIFFRYGGRTEPAFDARERRLPEGMSAHGDVGLGMVDVAIDACIFGDFEEELHGVPEFGRVTVVRRGEVCELVDEDEHGGIVVDHGMRLGISETQGHGLFVHGMGDGICARVRLFDVRGSPFFAETTHSGIVMGCGVGDHAVDVGCEATKQGDRRWGIRMVSHEKSFQLHHPVPPCRLGVVVQEEDRHETRETHETHEHGCFHVCIYLCGSI